MTRASTSFQQMRRKTVPQRVRSGGFSGTQPAPLDELKAQFINNGMKTLLRVQIEHDLVQLEQRVQAFVRQLTDLTRIDVLDHHGQFRFLRRLLNYDGWRIDGNPNPTKVLDRQVVNSDIRSERDHLRVGDHIVRILTMKEAMSETLPLALDAFLKIPANFCAVSEWVPLPAAAARKEVNKRRRHFNISKTGFVSQLGNDPATTNPRDVLVDESKQADIENLGDCLRALGDGQQLGEFSLTIVLYGKDRHALDQACRRVRGHFHQCGRQPVRGNLQPAQRLLRHRSRRLCLQSAQTLPAEHQLRRPEFPVHHPAGEKTNAYLGTEYLAVLETDNDTPYYLNLHCGEIGHTLILGQTGSGKTFFSVFMVQNAQKYQPQTYIFDIGGSYESVTAIFGGTYLNVGRESRDFTINPFALAPSPENLQFLSSFFRVLIEGRDQRYRMDFKEEQKLWSAIERMYTLEPGQRTVSNFASIIGELKDRLHRWTRAGQYGFLFDNAEDTLSFKDFQTFNFQGWGDAPELLEPLLFYVLHRASNEIANPAKLGTFKMFLMDEAWLFFRNETIRSYIVQAEKTWRKHKAAMILATQSLKELQESGLLPVVAECCPTKIFLANPEMDRAVYAEVFHLNDTEVELIAGLIPPGQMVIRQAHGSKKVRLIVDPITYWMATNNANDNLKKWKFFEQFGFADGLRRLAEESEGRLRAASATTPHLTGVAA